MAATDQTPIIVLAGGASRRMGTDKRETLIEGVPMLLRTLARLGPAPTLLIVDPRLPIALPLPPRVQVVPDSRPGEGPLAALEAGLLATTAPIVALVAGDMPWLEPAVIRLLTRHLEVHVSAEVACLTDQQGPRPLPLAIRVAPTLVRLTRLLDSGERRLLTLLTGAAVLPLTEWLPLDPSRGTLRDVDTPADLAVAG